MYRVAGLEFANRKDLLSGEGSKLFGGRWTPKGSFPAVYGSLTPETALLETLGTGGKYGIPYEQRMPIVMVAVNIHVNSLLDLTLPVVRKTLRLSLERMVEEDWEAAQSNGVESQTQAIARLAYQLGCDALKVPSARLKGEINLVIFPGNSAPGALTIYNVDKLPESKQH
jgi:RES domain-containing protein